MAARIPPPSRGAGMRPRPVERLASLKNPNPSPPASRPQPKPTTHPKTTTCPNPGCPAPNIVEDDGQKVCSGCGTVVAEANIVSEITFGEAASGAAIVQGTFVGADQSHGRSFGPGFQRGGGMESREITEQNGNRYISQLSRALNIPESASKAASQVFKLAVGLNFIQGRRTKTVAAVCLYVACRRQNGNTVMLIDFADVLMINVFKLGKTYKALLDELRLGGNVFVMNPIDPESLIYRFCKQLEFGSSMMQVASEAARIVQRMNRDWMITGRRPAGICGAALILAARMNNFRRTVREVVYVVKVTELTIHQRLNEFKATESGELTVDQFRSVELEHSHDPPAFKRAKEGKNRRKAREATEEVEGDNEERDETATPEPSPSSPSATKEPRRVDADGFVIPDLPIDPELLAAGKDKNGANSEGQEQTASASNGEDESAKKGKGRSRGSRAVKVPPPTEAQLASESALEDEMTALLASGSTLMASAEAPPPQLAQSTPEKESTPQPSSESKTAPAPPNPPKPVSSSTDIDPDEFDSDLEVSNCLLSPGEVEIKERIWVHENKDYLRTQQAKALKRALTEADAPDKPAQRPRKRRKGRMGDVGYLNGEGEDGKNSRASTPAEATRMMLEKRGFSKKINYKLLEDLYDDDAAAGKDGDKAKGKAKGIGGRESEDEYLSRSQSRSISVASDRGFGGKGRLPGRSKFSRGKAVGGAAGSRASSIAPSPSPRASPAPRTNTRPSPSVPPPTARKAPEPQPEKPANPNEEILGYLPEPEPGAQGKKGYGSDEYDEDEDEDDFDEGEEDDDARINAAFAGDYYDEASDGGYDDDDY